MGYPKKHRGRRKREGPEKKIRKSNIRKMNNLNKSRFVGLAIFLIPIITINIILILSQSFEFSSEPTPGNWYGLENADKEYFKGIKIYNAGDALRDKQSIKTLGYAIPYIDGTTSISRLGRVFPNNLIFKPLMIITGVLLILFWFYQKKIFNYYDVDKKITNKISYLGYVSGITLILHTIFLGLNFDNSLIKILLKINLAICVISAISCKFFYVKLINSLSEKNQILKNVYFKLQELIVNILIIVLLFSFFFFAFEVEKSIIQMIEWNYFVLIFLFYFFYFFGSKDLIHNPSTT